MRKTLALVLCLLFALTACGTDPHLPDNSMHNMTLVEDSLLCEYSNLAGDTLRSELDDLLDNAGISPQRRQVFWDHVNQFNDAVDSSAFLDGYESADILHPGYDPYELQDQWAEKYPEFGGYNCRITAYSLIGDYVTISDQAEIRDDDLFMDIESLEADDTALIDGSMEGFRTLFSNIPTENTTDTAIHIQTIQADWAERGITFSENNTLSLVTVWFHNQWSETENELFIGHTGVLIESCDDLFFIEKVAFQEPYQVIKLPSRQALNDYLMAKYDNQWGQETAAPFVMENSAPLLG